MVSLSISFTLPSDLEAALSSAKAEYYPSLPQEEMLRRLICIGLESAAQAEHPERTVARA